jgi:5-methyltetrahydrofolate--homocysteine methyltransferase
MQEDKALRLAQEMLKAGGDPQAVLDAGKEALAVIGSRYEQGEYFLPELIVGGEIFTQLAELVRPELAGATTEGEMLGTVVIGTVAGDIHDIGKDIVAFMLEVSNFQVYDLGVDVPAATFVEKIKEVEPEVVGMSGFLTLAFDQMKATVEAITEAGLRDNVKIMIGGAPMDDAAAQYIGADAFGSDAVAAVKLAQGWVGG